MKIITLLLFPILTFSQLSKRVDSLYQVIYATNQVQNDFIGIGSDGMTDAYYDALYNKLDSLATDDELLYIAEKTKKVIKHQINAILIDRKSKYLTKLFTKEIFDEEKIYIRGGCTGYSSSFAGEMYNYLFSQNELMKIIQYYKENDLHNEIYNLNYQTKWTKIEVDSLLTIFNKIALSNDEVLPVTLNNIFGQNNFKFENYERIKYFANKYPTPEILGTLASFGNKKDLPLFHQNFDNAYYAIRQFPDKSFIPELKNKVDKVAYDNEFLKAIASFCSKDSEELLLMVLAEFEKEKNEKGELDFFDGERLGYFYKYLEEKNCAVNDAILMKMWTEHRMISYSFFIKIKDKHYKEILQGYLKDLPFSSGMISDDFDFPKYKEEYYATDGYLCPIILNYLKTNASLNSNKSIDLDAIECKG